MFPITKMFWLPKILTEPSVDYKQKKINRGPEKRRRRRRRRRTPSFIYTDHLDYVRILGSDPG